jgi:hypothetical protein
MMKRFRERRAIIVLIGQSNPEHPSPGGLIRKKNLCGRSGSVTMISDAAPIMRLPANPKQGARYGYHFTPQVFVQRWKRDADRRTWQSFGF